VPFPTLRVLSAPAMIALAACAPSDVAPPSDPSIAPVDPDMIADLEVDCEDEDGASVRCAWTVPVDQVIVGLDPTLPYGDARSRLDRALAKLGRRGLEAEVVGEIPALRTFQVRLDNDPSDPVQAAERWLDAEDRFRATKGVQTVAFNFPIAARTYVPMEADDDNADIVGSDRRALSIIDYYQAIPAFDAILGSSDLHPVRVGVLDSGLDLTTGEFDDVTVVNRTGADLVDDDGHGTAMAALIGADDGDGRMNGIASRVLGDRLTLVIGRYPDTRPSHAEALAALADLVSADVDLVNMSFGYSHRDRAAEGLSAQQFTDARRSWEQLMTGAAPDLAQAADVLFLAAVPNVDLVVSERNDFPSGISADNVVSVGGLDSRRLVARADSTARGPQVDLAGPATDLPLLGLGRSPDVENAWGTSGATAIVTAMAAILRSVDPSATAEDIKEALTDPDATWTASDEVGGVRPTLLRTVGTYLLEHNLGSGTAAVLDTFGGANDTPDPSGHVIHHLHAGRGTEITIQHGVRTVEDETIHDARFDRARGWTNNTGGITGGAPGFEIEVGDFHLGAGGIEAFALDEVVLLGSTGFGSMRKGPMMSPEFSGNATSGTFQLTGCELTTRSLPLDTPTLAEARITGDDAIIYAQVQGTLNATYEGLDFTQDPPVPDEYEVSADFDVPFALLLLGGDTILALEEACVGGYAYAP